MVVGGGGGGSVTGGAGGRVVGSGGGGSVVVVGAVVVTLGALVVVVFGTCGDSTPAATVSSLLSFVFELIKKAPASKARAKLVPIIVLRKYVFFIINLLDCLH